MIGVLINSENLNEQIVARGHGWVYKKNCTADYCNEWLKLEEKARDAQIGLWEDFTSIPTRED
jgi:endonuclease YncB( thermonuclease family)